MNNDSPIKALWVVLLVAMLTSSLVSATVVLLRPIQLNNQLLDRSRNIMRLSGLQATDEDLTDEDMLLLFRSLDARIVNLDLAEFQTDIDPYAYNQRKAVNQTGFSVSIPEELDRAGLSRRSIHAPAYLVWQDDQLERIILPIHGNGMWSAMYGYIALGADLNTITDALFYEQNETPGLGDQVTRPDWLAQWRGRKIYGEQGELRFSVSADRVNPGSPSAAFEVDALTGATVTADAVTGLVHYWFGPHGYQPFLDQLREQAPTKPISDEDS